jgi:hypothetical protein
MELVKFRDNIYGRLSGKLFLWEPTWDSFRPFTRLAWDGVRLTHVCPFTEDIWNPYYGYGSAEMKQLCRRLMETTELSHAKEMSSIEQFWVWCKTPTEWWFDRPCVFASPCVSRTQQGWKRYIYMLSSKPRTRRHGLHPRMTRRLRLSA